MDEYETQINVEARENRPSVHREHTRVSTQHLTGMKCSLEFESPCPLSVSLLPSPSFLLLLINSEEIKSETVEN